ncbi:MAG TPA: hypothetical protein VHS29_11440, partial [Candidatus Acidoferrales bacterium]|nr:hypothetical protein [Candidatus Acidoferrales bacterium]
VGGAVVKEMATVLFAPVIVIVTTAVAVWVLVDVAVIVALAAALGAVYVVVAPLAVCAGLKVPHAPTGAQVQSTPAFVESFTTVAEIMAVPFAAKDAGGACVSEIDVFPDGFDGDDPTAPQPEMLRARNTITKPANKPDVHVARTFFTTSSSLS